MLVCSYKPLSLLHNIRTTLNLLLTYMVTLTGKLDLDLATWAPGGIGVQLCISKVKLPAEQAVGP